MSQKPTINELLLRVDTIYGMLCDGKSRTDILRQGTELWSCSERTLDSYIAKARVKLEEDCRMSREAFMAEALAGYRSLREQAERRGQLMCAKQCLDAQIALVGLGSK